MQDETSTLRTKYERFDARDIAGVAVATADGVEWADGLDGGHVRGKDAVRDYRTRQSARIGPHVEPLSFRSRDDGAVLVEVRQTLFDLAGRPLDSAGED